jgi:branched-chain amino acid transport system substrate-binding protein
MKSGLRLSLYFFIAACVVTVLGLGPSAPAAEYKEYLLGMTNPRSGDQVPTGDQQVCGVATAVKEINAKGGIDGVPIRVIYEDNQAKPTVAVMALTKLINVDKVPLAFTTYSTAQLAQVPIADKNKVVMINVGASSTELINCGKYIFHIQPNSSTYLEVGTNYMCQVLGLKGKWAILYLNDAMGRSFNHFVGTLLPKYGVKDIFHDNWESSSVTDYRPIIAKALNFKPEAVFVGGFGTDSGQCLRQLRDAGFKGPAESAWGGGVVEQTAGLGVYNTYYGEQVIPDNARVQGLREECTKVKKLPFIDQQTINSYDGVYLAADAIKYAKDHFGGNYFTGEKLRQAILDKKKFDNLTAPGTIDPKTQILSRQLAVKTWKEQGGKPVIVTLKVYSSEEMAALPSGELK